MKYIKTTFIDVGGHLGETLDEVFRDDYEFDQIHCFEPQASCFKFLEQKYKFHEDNRYLVLHNFGLSDQDKTVNLYGGGSGASAFADKNNVDSSVVQDVNFLKASKFFDTYLDKKARIIMKLNCEGGEIAILQNLIDNGHIHWIYHVRIDFDCRKIPSQQHKENQILAALKKANFTNFQVVSNEGKYVSHTDGIRLWLSQLDDAEKFMRVTLFEKILRLLPNTIKKFVQRLRKKLYKSFGLLTKSNPCLKTTPGISSVELNKIMIDEETAKDQLQEILDILNKTKKRATYGAVYDYLNISRLELITMLGNPRIETCWIVREDTGVPGRPANGFEFPCHPDLHAHADYLKNRVDLKQFLKINTK